MIFIRRKFLTVIAFFCILLLPAVNTHAQSAPIPHNVLTGAERMDQYLPLLSGKRVALLINQTSRVGNTLLVDTLLKRGIQVKKILVPEHGFRGTADAGAHIDNSKDPSTGLPVISLYGNNKKPTAAQLSDIDILVYDLQDVGVRFYTYISTLQYAMEACAENGKTLLVLDRPNPNDYVDGPILDASLTSFVGMQPIPVVYGMTAAEYSQMLVGEKWFKATKSLKLEIVKVAGWSRGMHYDLPVAPSPNLRTAGAIARYPSLCFFEGTVISVGRGTDKPFEQWGHPLLKSVMTDSFKPVKTVGASDPPYKDQWCYGMDMTVKGMRWSITETEFYPASQKIDLKWLLLAYHRFPDKATFFNPFFEKLAGTKELRRQIEAGQTEESIRASWQPGLDKFNAIRTKYLLYQ